MFESTKRMIFLMYYDQIKFHVVDIFGFLDFKTFFFALFLLSILCMSLVYCV